MAKVESHLDEAAIGRRISRRDWLGNHWVDQAVGSAAVAAALPGTVIANVKWIDRVGKLIRDRGVALARVSLEDKEPLDIKVKPPKVTHREKLLQRTTHKVALGAEWRCARCPLRPSGQSSVAVNRWLRLQCVPMETVAEGIAEAPQEATLQVGRLDIHRSHAPFFHEETGFWACSVCGCVGKQHLGGLGRECRKPARNGRDNFSRLSRGLMPGHTAEAYVHNRGHPNWGRRASLGLVEAFRTDQAAVARARRAARVPEPRFSALDEAAAAIRRAALAPLLLPTVRAPPVPTGEGLEEIECKCGKWLESFDLACAYCGEPRPRTGEEGCVPASGVLPVAVPPVPPPAAAPPAAVAEAAQSSMPVVLEPLVPPPPLPVAPRPAREPRWLAPWRERKRREAEESRAIEASYRRHTSSWRHA